MRTIYVLGAGFSKSCGIATDPEMLVALNKRLPRAPGKLNSEPKTSIEHFLEQAFKGRNVGFEQFMSTLSGLKFMPSYLKVETDIFSEIEAEIACALRDYLTEATAAINFGCSGNPVRKFCQSVDWNVDLIITFNYDLLLEGALKATGTSHDNRILHLHGSLNDGTLVYPNTRKFTDRSDRISYAGRWRAAFQELRDHTNLRKLVFIGYSMPPSDYEARGLFNYTDWYRLS